MSSSHTIEILMSEFMNLLMLSILKKTFKLSSSRMLESDSDLMSAKNMKKKMLTRLIIDNLSEINIVDDSCRWTLIDQRAIHFAAFAVEKFAAAIFATNIKFECEQAKYLHYNQLSLSSKHQKKMLDHSFRDEFLTAVKKKYMNLKH